MMWIADRRRSCGIASRKACAAVLLAALAMPGIAGADETSPKLEITVRDAISEGKIVKVPVNKSVLVDFSQPVHEVRVAQPDIAEVAATTPKQILLTGKQFGSTQVVVWFNEDSQSVIDVSVELQLDQMLMNIRSAVPRSQIKAYKLLESVVLTGTVPDANAAKQVMEIASAYTDKLIDQVRVAGVQQVLLRCTVAEVNRSATRQLGFNGWMAGSDFPNAFFANNLDQINPTNIGAAADVNVAGRVPFLTGTDGIPVTGRSTLTFGFPRVEMQVFVEALKENGLLRVLAEPNLVTISGQEAYFTAGGEFPVPVPNQNGITIEWREFGVRLNFTPAVESEKAIRLIVAPEVSEPDFSTAVTVLGTTIPGLSKRRVETVVELASGQTFAIGGLLSERVRAVSRSVPGLGEVPVLGALFRSVDFQSQQSELVVLVTPELVEPVSSDQITYIPGANYIPPNDFELFLMGAVESARSKELPALRPRVAHGGWPTTTGDAQATTAGIKLRGPLGPAGGAEGGYAQASDVQPEKD